MKAVFIYGGKNNKYHFNELASIKLMYIIYEQCENKHQKYILNCVKYLNKSSEVVVFLECK